MGSCPARPVSSRAVAVRMPLPSPIVTSTTRSLPTVSTPSGTASPRPTSANSSTHGATSRLNPYRGRSNRPEAAVTGVEEQAPVAPHQAERHTRPARERVGPGRCDQTDRLGDVNHPVAVSRSAKVRVHTEGHVRVHGDRHRRRTRRHRARHRVARLRTRGILPAAGRAVASRQSPAACAPPTGSGARRPAPSAPRHAAPRRAPPPDAPTATWLRRRLVAAPRALPAWPRATRRCCTSPRRRRRRDIDTARGSPRS